jgi:hypothetical protein
MPPEHAYLMMKRMYFRRKPSWQTFSETFPTYGSEHRHLSAKWWYIAPMELCFPYKLTDLKVKQHLAYLLTSIST